MTNGVSPIFIETAAISTVYRIPKHRHSDFTLRIATISLQRRSLKSDRIGKVACCPLTCRSKEQR